MLAHTRFLVHVIDDDEAVRESLEALLVASGIEAETYCSAEDFLARVQSSHGCLLLDVNMPGMSGLDLLQNLADQGRQIPVVLLTASPDERIRARAEKLGASAYLAKPVTEGDLLRAIAGAVDGNKGSPL